MTRTELLKIAKPMLFNTDMVRAILEDRKTATRRAIKPQPPKDIQCALGYCTDGDKKDIGKFAFGRHESGGKMVFYKPPCKVGDILYVRETWFIEEYYDDEALIRFKAGGKQGLDYEAEGKLYHKLNKFAHDKWNPSLFMPKEAARIFLKVKDVRVEQLQDMTEDDAFAEGVSPWDDRCYARNGWKPTFHDPDSGGPCCPLDAFEDIWDSTIKKSELALYGWDANPWVWVIEFERIEVDE